MGQERVAGARPCRSGTRDGRDGRLRHAPSPRSGSTPSWGTGLPRGENRRRPTARPGGDMFDRFTDRARKVMGLARQEAQRFNHDYIGTEHILLGLVQEGSGVAASVLKNLDIDLKKIRHEVEKLVSTGTTMGAMGQLPFTPRAKKVLELSLEEASNLGHTYIGTEHLLLGLIRENEGIAAQVLRNLKVKLEDVREEVLELLGADPQEEGQQGEEPAGEIGAGQGQQQGSGQGQAQGKSKTPALDA